MSKAIARALCGFVFVTVWCTLASNVQAQQDRSRGTSPGRDAFEAARARERNLQNREMVMEHVGDDAKTTDSSERFKTLAAQIKDDFRRMQIVNNEMMKAASLTPSLDYKQIFDATGEINKCAKRLKTNLSVFDSDEDKKQKALAKPGHAEMKLALFRLDELVMSFVTGLAAVDSQNASRSGRDLREIIELSDHLRRNTERLIKTPERP